MVAPLLALISDFAALLDVPADAAMTNRIERPPSYDDRSARRNGSRSLNAGSAALSHPANPVQSREWSRTLGNCSFCKDRVNCHRNQSDRGRPNSLAYRVAKCPGSSLRNRNGPLLDRNGILVSHFSWARL
jgi:hypothetical protein